MDQQLLLPLGWTQRWRERRHSWRHVGEGGFNRHLYDCTPVADNALVRNFVKRHHYSASWPASQLTFGMFETGGDLVGVAVLGVPAHPAVLSRPFPDLVPYEESVELSRLVILDHVHANAETYLLGRLFRHLRAETPVRGVVAFSDPQPRRTREGVEVMPGHWGTIYQAKSAHFLGRGRARLLTMLPDATVLHDRALAKVMAGEQGWRYVVERLIVLGATPPRCAGPPGKVWLTGALAKVGARRVRHGGNLRYAFALHRRVRLGLPTQTYPKRDGP